ncbi:MAG: hypothetical protein GF334_00680 [Candidatus Altiarchaeales archaeon]|nr:hypothetical protein [Candidatus Altiarchaeales archaeon]
MKIQGVVPDWNNGAKEYAAKISDFCDIDVFTVPGFDHEPNVLNKAIDQCEADYLWFLHVDDEILYPETAHELAEFLDANPTVGVTCPNREGEPRGFRQPFKWYLADNTCVMYRKSVGVQFDSDFVFTGWNDLDFGESVINAGYDVAIYGLLSVLKHPTPYGSWSSFRNAYNARNRLLLEAKWWWIGIDFWQGVDYYNQHQATKTTKIPTMFELAWWSEDKLTKFAESVDMEHPQIYIRNDQQPGNADWSINKLNF